MKQRLCFSCLNSGHQSKDCYKKKPCSHCEKKHATVLHPSTSEVVVGVGTQPGSVGTEGGEGRPQSLNSQSNTVQNTVQNTSQSTGDHFCGLTTMEGCPVTALPIVAVKVKVKGSPLYIETSGQAHCSFLVGKSRLAPLKQMSISRLELAPATVSVRLNRLLKNELEIPIYKITFWTDSMTVLRYIANDSKRFHTYVANRVAIIREDSSPSQWRYIESKSNPADDASRGTSADAFILNDRWIKGAGFPFKASFRMD